MPIASKPPIDLNNDDEHYEVLVKDKQRMIRSMILS